MQQVVTVLISFLLHSGDWIPPRFLLDSPLDPFPQASRTLARLALLIGPSPTFYAMVLLSGGKCLDVLVKKLL